MADTPSYLDYVFFSTLSELKPFITCVNNATYIELIKRWLDKLSDEKITDKAMRNNYLFLLETQIKDGVLTTPFTNEPPEHIFEESVDDNDFTCDSPLERASSEEMFSCRTHYPKSPHSLPSMPRIEAHSEGFDPMAILEEKLASGVAKTNHLGRRISNLAEKVSAAQEDTRAEGPLLVRKHDVAISSQTDRSRSIRQRLYDVEKMYKQFLRRNQDTKLRMQTLHEWYKRKFSELKFSLRQKFTEEYEEKVRELELQFQTNDDKERRRFEAEMDKLQALYDSINAERERRLEKEREERERREERDREERSRREGKERSERHRRETEEREERDRREREERESCMERERREEEARREEREHLERRTKEERREERDRLDEMQRRFAEERREEKQQREEKERRDEEERRAERERLDIKELRLQEERREEQERFAELQRQIEAERRAERLERAEEKRLEMEQRYQAKREHEEKQHREEEKRREERMLREQEMQRLKEQRRLEKRQCEKETKEMRALYDRNITELRETLVQDYAKQRDEWCKKSDKLGQHCAELEQERVLNLAEITKLKEMSDEFRATIQWKDAKLLEHERLRKQLETDREQSQAEARGQILHYQNVVERERVQFRDNLEKQQQNLAALEERLAKERQQHDDKLAELSLETSAERNDCKKAIGRCNELYSMLESVERDHQKEIETIRTEHETQMAELQAQHQREIDAKDARLDEIAEELKNKCSNPSTKQLIQDVKHLKNYIKNLRELLLHSENRFNARFVKALRENDFHFKSQEILMSISRVNLIADVSERRYREFAFVIDKLEQRFIQLVEDQQQHFAKERRHFVEKMQKLSLSTIINYF